MSGAGDLAGGDALSTADVDSQLWAELTAELERAIGAAGRREASQQVPDGEGSRVSDLAITQLDEGVVFAWAYANPGDYNQDGLVGVSDLTPVGVYFGAAEGDPQWPWARVADGSGDGQITVADITAIGQNWLNQISGYRLETAPAADAALWEQVAEATIADGPIPAAGGLRRYELELADPVDGNWYRVTPYLGEVTGLAGDAVQYIAPEPNLTWAHTVGTSHWDLPGGLAVDSEGNIYTAGSLHLASYDVDSEACSIAKWAPDGESIWALGGQTEFYDQMYQLVLTGSGDLVGLADLWDNEESRRYYVLIGVSTDGNVVWNREITCSPRLSNVQLSAAPNGDLLLSGTVILGDGEECGVLAAQLSPDGTPRWQRAVILPSADYTACTRLVTDGQGFIWTGVIMNYFSAEPDFEMAILKLSPTGEVELARIWDTTRISDDGDLMSWHNAFGGAPTGAYLIGRIAVDELQLYSTVVMRVAGDGTVAWTREYSSKDDYIDYSQHIYPCEIVHTSGGHPLLVGSYWYQNDEPEQYYLEELFVPLADATGIPLADADAYRPFNHSYAMSQRTTCTTITDDALVHLGIAEAAIGEWGTRHVDSTEITVVEFTDLGYRVESASLQLADLSINWSNAEVALDTVEQIGEEPLVSNDGVDLLLLSRESY